LQGVRLLSDILQFYQIVFLLTFLTHIVAVVANEDNGVNIG